MEIAKKLKVESETTIAYSNIGICYLSQDNYEQARLYLDSARYKNNNSFNYKILVSYLDKVKLREYMNTINTQYMIISIFVLFILLMVIGILFIKTNRKLNWNRKQIHLVIDAFSAL